VAFDARKTRLSVPSAFRAVLARTGNGEPDVVLRPSNNSPCIDVWPKATFETEVDRRLEGLDPFGEEYERITDELTVPVHETRVDADGRIVLPRTLLAELPLDANAMIVGRKSHFQIWSAPVWADRQAAIKARPKPVRTPPAAEGTAA
jgi:MraZ protein